jgi:hypothetical protein
MKLSHKFDTDNVKKDRIISKETIQYYCSLQSSLENERSQWTSYWDDVATYLLPNAGPFNSIVTSGSRKDLKIVDSTANLALSKFASSVVSMTMPSSQKYHRLSVFGKKIQSKEKDILEYLDSFNDALFLNRYRSSAGFSQNINSVILELGAFGNGVLFTYLDKRKACVCYKAIPISKCYFSDEIFHIKEDRTVFQLVDMFGIENVSEEIRNKYKCGKLLDYVTVLHFVHPSHLEYDKSSLGINRFKYLSVYIEESTKHIISESGFNSFPFSVVKYSSFAREPYGRGIGMDILPSIKMLNRMKLSMIRFAEISDAPPLLATDAIAGSAWNYQSGAINPGFLNDRGEPQVIPLKLNSGLPITRELINDERELINDAFFVNLFRVLVDAPVASATEVMQRAQEKGQLLEPILGRIQSELLGPMIRREIELLQELDGGTYTLVPKPPDIMKKYVSSQYDNVDTIDFSVEYSSPLNMARQAGVASTMLQTFQAITPLMQIKPEIAKKYNFLAASEFIARANGMPENILLSDQEVEQKNQEEISQQQAQQLLEAVPALAGSAKNFAQAQSLAGAGSAQVAPQLFPDM